jgi:hypothetical protein
MIHDELPDSLRQPQGQAKSRTFPRPAGISSLPHEGLRTGRFHRLQAIHLGISLPEAAAKYALEPGHGANTIHRWALSQACLSRTMGTDDRECSPLIR